MADEKKPMKGGGIHGHPDSLYDKSCWHCQFEAAEHARKKPKRRDG